MTATFLFSVAAVAFLASGSGHARLLAAAMAAAATLVALRSAGIAVGFVSVLLALMTAASGLVLLLPQRPRRAPVVGWAAGLGGLLAVAGSLP
jgi:hypothetical protein